MFDLNWWPILRAIVAPIQIKLLMPPWFEGMRTVQVEATTEKRAVLRKQDGPFYRTASEPWRAACPIYIYMYITFETHILLLLPNFLWTRLILLIL